MGKISNVLRDYEGGGLSFFCPGCKNYHGIRVGDGPHPRWGWNGNAEKPTFSPSILVTGRDFTAAGQQAYDEWYEAGCPPLDGRQFESRDIVCHSFVTDGRIQFLGDCTHELAGQTVDLPMLPGTDGALD